MGLFGLFASLIGLGAMAKDVVSDAIDDGVGREKAIHEGRSTYIAGGKIKSTETGRQCSRTTDYLTRHDWLIDTKTGERIEDITDSINRAKQREIKRLAEIDECKFYRTTRFDNNMVRSWVYVNDDMPGKFFRQSGYGDKMKFVEGILEPKYGLRKHGELQVGLMQHAMEYKPDGTLIGEEPQNIYNWDNVEKTRQKDRALKEHERQTLSERFW